MDRVLTPHPDATGILKAAKDHPLIFPTDDATEVARWFVHHIDKALIAFAAPSPREREEVHGVTFLFIRDGKVLLERCPKKAVVLRVGEWFVPGGKLEPGETAYDALGREINEELHVIPTLVRPLPIVEGSPVPPGPKGTFLIRPYLVEEWIGELPERTCDESVPLSWFDVREVIATSPVPQVRMMVAAALAPTPLVEEGVMEPLLHGGRPMTMREIVEAEG